MSGSGVFAQGALCAPHLPPSAERPRVLALDSATAAELAALAEVALSATAGTAYDAVAGRWQGTPEALAELVQHLRPGGRLILAAPADSAADPEDLLAALVGAGCVHCLVEPAGALTLYRGERPPEAGSTLARAQQLAAAAPAAGSAPLPRFLFLLVTQTPNKPAWKLAPGERVEWRAATSVAAPSDAPRLLAFSSLVKAVAFMQPAILAGAIGGVNKVAKFPAAAAPGWGLPLLLNPSFEALRAAGAVAGPALAVEPAAAIRGEE